MKYTYLIGWSKLDKWYYGSRYSKSANPKDLWVTYFTSSNYVKNFRKINGEPDIIQVHKIFSCRNKCLLYEDKVIRRMKMVHSNKWLNKGNSGVEFHVPDKHPFLGKKHSEETKEKIRISRLGKKHSKETREKMASLRKGKKPACSMTGKKHSEETKEKMRIKSKGFSEETRIKQKLKWTGSKHSKETVQKMIMNRPKKYLKIKGI